MHSLDSHPQIGCERYEPLNPDSSYMKRLNKNREGVMRALWERPGYRVSMFKLTYRQIGWVGWDILYDYNPVIIHLHRENAFRAILSSMINTATVRGDMNYVSHSYTYVSPPKIDLSLKKLWVELEKYEGAVKEMKKKLKKLEFPKLYLTYEQLTHDFQTNQLPPDITNSICGLLGVEERPMINQLAKLNNSSFDQVIINWDEVREEFSNTQYAKYL